MDRRQMLAGGLAGGLAGALAGSLGAPLRAFAQTDPELAVSDGEGATGPEAGIRRIMLADFERGRLAPGTPGYLGFRMTNVGLLPPDRLFRTVMERLLDEIADEDLTLDWAEDPFSPDYRHLAAPRSLTPFPVEHEGLEAAARRNGFALRDDVVLFGLRGAGLFGETESGFIAREATPNHRDYRCVIGVWNRAERRVAAFPGSTAPAAPFVLAQQRLKSAGRVANMLPTGMHLYAVGPHRGQSEHPQPGAFRQLSPVAVLRSYGRGDGAQAFTIYERWDLESEIVEDNIHAGSLDLAPFRDRVFFSSAGCQTLPGGYTDDDARTPVRDWAAFRAAAGLEPAPSYAANWTSPDDGAQFPYMLLTGRDLRLATLEPEDRPELRRLRFGSSGPAVEALQASLEAPETGVFDLATQRAFLRWQLLREGGADGIVTPQIARTNFGVEL